MIMMIGARRAFGERGTGHKYLFCYLARCTSKQSSLSSLFKFYGCHGPGPARDRDNYGRFSHGRS